VQGGAGALCVPVSTASLSLSLSLSASLFLLHRGLGVPLRNLCLLYGQENKEASY